MSRSKLRVGLRLQAEAVRFSFDGREYVGRSGDTAASALRDFLRPAPQQLAGTVLADRSGQ